MKARCTTTGMCWRLCLFVLLVLILSGCVSNQYLTPISSFRDKTQQTVGTLSDFYAMRNSFEIDLYLQTVSANKDVQVLKFFEPGVPTPLGKPYFLESSIKARIEALNLISVYASRLYDLASTSAPTGFQTAATALGQNLTSLDKTFQNLQGASDPTANKYVGPIHGLVGIIGAIYLNRQRDELLKKAIEEGAPQVDIILSQIRDDLTNIFLPQIITGTNESLATLMDAYNKDRKDLTYEQRVARLSSIKAGMLSASAAASSAPSSLVVAMMNAHKALVLFAGDPESRRAASFAAFNSALNEWANQLENLTTQVKLLIK